MARNVTLFGREGVEKWGEKHAGLRWREIQRYVGTLQL